MLHHPCAHGIELYVAITAEHVPGRFRHARPESSLPECSSTLVAAIEVLHVALAEISHEEGARALRSRRNQKVYMVRHEAVRMHPAIVFLGELAQMRQVHQVIAVLLEAGQPIVAPLNDMDGYARENQPRWPGHSRNNGLPVRAVDGPGRIPRSFKQ